MSRKPPTDEEWRRDQATRAAVLHWWLNRQAPREEYQPGDRAGYIGSQDKWYGTTGYVRALVPPVEGYRAIQFGGEEDGQPAVVICCLVEELVPL